MSNKKNTSLTVDREGFDESYRDVFNAVCDKLEEEHGFSRGLTLVFAIDALADKHLGERAKVKIINDYIKTRSRAAEILAAHKLER